MKLRNVEHLTTREIGGDTLIGRSSLCGLHLTAEDVSKEHAMLRWTGARWELRDLDSRNGTFVNGHSLGPKQHRTVDIGTQLMFGAEEHWICIDATPPMPRATTIDEGELRTITAEQMLCFREGNCIDKLAYRNAQGQWLLEHQDGAELLRSGHELEHGGRRWRLYLPALDATTTFSNHPRNILRAKLHFAVKPSEVAVTVTIGAERFTLRKRSYHHLLLALARARLADAARGLDEDEAGWLEISKLMAMTGRDRNFINVNVCRARKRFVELGFVDAACIVERQLETDSIRIAVSQLQVEPS